EKSASKSDPETALVRDAGGLPGLARAAPRDEPRARAAPVQDPRAGAGERVRGGARRGALLRLDRRRAPRARRGHVPPALLAAEGEERVERGQHPARERAGRGGAHARAGAPLVRGPPAPAGPLLVRVAPRRPAAPLRPRVPPQRAGLGALPGPAALVPAHQRALGDQREAGGTAAPPLRAAPGRVGARLRGRPAEAPRQEGRRAARLQQAGAFL